MAANPETKPVLLTVDDDPQVLSGVARDLNRHYGQQYRVVRAPSGQVALEALRQLKQREEPVALMLVDQRMPEMSGVEFLEEARQLFPDAKRVLLTAYADNDAAIRAINSVKIHYYLMKPWDPAEDHLFPVLDDLLDEWRAQYRPRFEGLRIIGHRWSPQTHGIKDFLARNQMPYQWLDVEQEGEACRLLTSLELDREHLPVVLFEDRTWLCKPTIAQIAEKIEMHTRPIEEVYDLIIVGGGPAGLAAAVYGASEGLKTLVVEREAMGGQAGTSSRIENYLGFPQGISGEDLARRALDQARRLGAEILCPQEVVGIRIEHPYRIVRLTDGSEISGYTVMLTTGVSWRRLDVPGVERLTGAGIYYGAARTEGPSCRDESIYLVGGANSAGQGAIYFSEYANEVTMLVRGESLQSTMSQYLIDQIDQTPNIKKLFCCTIAGVEGTDRLEAITLCNADTGKEEKVPASSLFIFIGALPCTEWLRGVIALDAKGFIPTGSQLMNEGKWPEGWALDRDPYLLETSVPGIFAAGDVRHDSIKRCAAGVGAGSMAVAFVHQYLAEVK